MKSIVMKALLFLSIASLTAATTAQEKHAHTHTTSTLHPHDEGDELRHQDFIVDLDCQVSKTTNPAELILTCGLKSARKVPRHT
ncbi:hypothetical protein OCU04_007824 [Sclerotinia nivalis]|uniref:Uncharacterized protein n=1 Tax=Sclerotinia nivalis TaxID=352851 RepID=A0A9X0DIA7_9HELO|nr:hypothetical protein OCU04_007824 [Sclerotinia nivalis]